MNSKLIKEHVSQIETAISDARHTMRQAEIANAAKRFPGSAQMLVSLENTLTRIQAELLDIPQVNVALVGRSRHGKSTLINSLAGEDILQTSSTRPCSATIVKLAYATEWSIEIHFVSQAELKRDWKNAVRDAKEFLSGENEQPDNPRYLQETLERFIELFKIDKHLPDKELLNAVENYKIPTDDAKFLGKKLENSLVRDLDKLRQKIAEHLSTDGHLWTIVDRCTIKGPFANWHPQLGVIDLPGTNDLNAHRAQITNSVRNQANAVALVTSESNLGIDIEAWLRESQVLANFIEAKESRRQHLFIIRTQLDGHIPQYGFTPDSNSPLSEDEQEEKALQDAIAKYKEDQTAAYHDMLRDMVSPLLKVKDGLSEQVEKRTELLKRVSDVPVHFVSALAYEVFNQRQTLPARKRREMLADFNHDENQTGIPALLGYLNQIAADYLENNFYEDKKREIESEVAQLGQFFRTQQTALAIAKQGAGGELSKVTNTIRRDVLPWIENEISTTVREFHGSGISGSDALQHRMEQTWALSERRLQDKVDKWNQYAWNSLRAMGRKGGTHVTSNGTHMDIAQDICSVLVDDLILVWTSYRDHVIEKQVNRVTQDFSKHLIEKLQEARSIIDDADGRSAINDMINQLGNIAHLNREELLRSVEARIRELESIRQPAYQKIKHAFRPTFDRIAEERGTGCQQRMRQILESAFREKLGGIKSEINLLVNNSASGLLNHCTEAMTSFGKLASSDINKTLDEVKAISVQKDLATIERDSLVLEGAVKLLPAPV